MKNLIWNAHPYLFTLVSILFVYLAGTWSFSPLQMIAPLLILWLLLLSLHPLANKLAGDRNWGSILLTIFVFGLLFQEALFKVVAISFAIIAFVFMIGLRLMKMKITILEISRLLTMFSLVILVIEVMSLALDLKSVPIAYFQAMAERTANPPAVTLAPPANGERPDIYYIILDTYPSADVLQELFQYDNSDFINDLKGLGFVVPENAHSNYPRTTVSVSSTLDMQYWDEIAPSVQGLKFWWLAEPIFDHNQVRTSLESIGYQSVTIASNWGISNDPGTDLYFKPFPVILSDYENFFILSTPVKFIYAPLQKIAPIPSNATHRQFILFNFDVLEKLPTVKGPKFIVSHIIAPHAPFVIRADGSLIESSGPYSLDPASGLSIEEQKVGFVNEIEYLNKRLSSTIRLILENSETPPIIILQADHGSGLYLDYDSPKNTCMNERFSPFAAYYLPGKSGDIIPQDITPVNLFRIIFNEYFGADLSLLENRMYFTNGKTMFDLIEVTDQVGHFDGCSAQMDQSP